MARLRTDVVANILGQGWAVAISLLFVPFFVSRLGIESYAIIALLPLCTALLQVLDGGLAVTLNREMARLAPSTAPHEARSTAWTLQVVHLSAGIFFGLSAIALLPMAGMAWLQPKEVSASELHGALLLLAITVALQWPIPFLQNGLMGLGRQPKVNGLLAVYSTVLNVGAAVLITFADSSVSTFLGWAGACAMMHSIALAIVFWRSLPCPIVPVHFEIRRLREVMSFSAGAAGIGITGVILTHFDRIVGSRLLTLEQFGYYGLAATVGRSAYLLIAPVFSATFPRLSALVARPDQAGMHTLYSSATQIMCVAIFPLTAVVVWMGFDLGYAWLGNASTAGAIAEVAAVLSIGAALNGVMHLPYGLQLAHGMTRLGLQINVALVALSLPVAVLLCRQFGPIGLAATWPLTNALYFMVGVPLTHRMTGFGRALSWIGQDILPAAIASFTTVGVIHAAMGSSQTRLGAITVLLCSLVAGYASTAVAATKVRQELIEIVSRGLRLRR